ncbi:TDT family transporter [Streptomyces sp. RFCAC02]|uniref:TDT family transporter n=1 Tax=Streptomyces sp. RFCAC02 TaxID=2499143 RepID=UPI00101EE541|nr:TDT family transporter [Streptomyces sp. RFCAC02]
MLHRTAPPAPPPTGPRASVPAPAPPGRRLLPALDRPADAFRHLGPNWYASIMGTGITGAAAATLPVHVPGLRTAATVVWALAAALLVAVTAAWTLHITRHGDRFRAHADHPVMAYFWGAPPMALMTVGAGAVSLGRDWIGPGTAVAVGATLWAAGTALGLGVCVWIPYRVITRHGPAGGDAAFAGWLMPVVPPMVSAATGAPLVAHVPAGQARLTLLLACYALFGVSLLAALLVIAQVWNRLTHHGPGAVGMLPTLWIVLGPLGQSVTAAGVLGDASRDVLPGPYATGARVFGVLYGLPVWGFAMVWLVLATAVTWRTVRADGGGRLPFSLTWWSFTFPVGTCVTGTATLADHTGSDALGAVAVVLYVLLAAAWLVVLSRTVRAGTRGTLFLPAPAPARA